MTTLQIFPSLKQLCFLVVLGIAGGLLLIQIDEAYRHFFSAPKVDESQRRVEALPQVTYEVPYCLPATLGYQGEDRFKSEVKKTFIRRVGVIDRQTAVRKLVTSSVISPVPRNPKNPNSVIIHISQAPEPASAIRVNGKWVCAKKKDHPGKSGKYKKGHIDRQCCLDPDEIPNPLCDYSYRR